MVGGLLGHFLDSMLPQYMALPVREKYNSNQGGRLNFGILTVFINIRPAKVVNHTPWSCINMRLSEFLVWLSTWSFRFEPNVEKC